MLNRWSHPKVVGIGIWNKNRSDHFWSTGCLVWIRKFGTIVADRFLPAVVLRTLGRKGHLLQGGSPFHSALHGERKWENPPEADSLELFVSLAT